jgi:hypothetical protein
VKTLSRIAKWEVVLTPDFSLYYDCPRIMQMWNVYRSRWVGRWWVENGIKVIPTVSWGLHDSHDFCFLGLPERSVLAVSTVGTKKDPSLKVPYLAGFREMVIRLEPTVVLCYGRPYREMLDMVELKTYPDYWRGVADARRRYGNKWDNARIDIDENADEDDEFDFDF